MYEAHVQENFSYAGIDIYLIEGTGDRRFLRKSDGTMEELDPYAAVSTPPTIRLPEPAARALLDKLMQHFQGASDLQTIRGDLLHERDRRDKLEDAMTRIAEAAIA